MFPPYLFAYVETLKAEPAVGALRELAARRGARLWITGGTLRDVLLTRWPADLDLAVEGDPMALGRALARKTGGAFVPLDPGTGTVRVAIRSTQGIEWVDLVSLRAPSIEEDLRQRDFTINAIALPLEEILDGQRPAYLDPTWGRNDLHRQCIRMTSARAFDDDPARIVRAYRFAAQLGFTIEDETRNCLRVSAASISRPAAERLTQELRRMLTAPDPAQAVAWMMEDGVLPVLVPELARAVGVTQNDYHHLDVWNHSLETLQRLAALLRQPGPFTETGAFPYLGLEANREILAWAALFHDVGKPPCRGEDGRGIHFHGHDEEGRRMWAEIARRLRLPGKLSRRVGRLIRHHLRPLHLLREGGPDAVSGRAVARLYRDLADDLPGLFLLASADKDATRGPASRPDETGMAVLELYRHCERVHAERVRPVEETPPLLSGADLQTDFGLAPGPAIGRMLEDLRDAQISGAIADREQARAWVRKRLARQAGTQAAERGPN